MYYLNMFVFPTNFCPLLHWMYSVLVIVICAHVWLIWLNSAPWNGLSYTFFFFFFPLSNENSVTKEWAWIYVWPTEKQKKGWSCFFMCTVSFACSACCLWRTFQNVSFFSRAAIFIYLRIPERVDVQVNLPNPSLHFRLYKGKKTPLLRKHSKCSAPQRCYFYLLLFLFIYLKY